MFVFIQFLCYTSYGSLLGLSCLGQPYRYQMPVYLYTGIFFKPICGRVDRASATEAVDLGLIPGWVKPKTIKIGIHSFPA